MKKARILANVERIRRFLELPEDAVITKVKMDKEGKTLEFEITHPKLKDVSSGDGPIVRPRRRKCVDIDWIEDV